MVTISENHQKKCIDGLIHMLDRWMPRSSSPPSHGAIMPIPGWIINPPASAPFGLVGDPCPCPSWRKRIRTLGCQAHNFLAHFMFICFLYLINYASTYIVYILYLSVCCAWHIYSCWHVCPSSAQLSSTHPVLYCHFCKTIQYVIQHTYIITSWYIMIWFT